MVTATNAIGSTAAAGSASPSGLSKSAQLGQSDFLRLLTIQVQQQDPFDPVDNKEMLAQMAQFSSLSGIADMGSTLQGISSKLDTLTSALTTSKSIANDPTA
ncbi:MAG: hypothetical protein RLZZ08_2111 [Pseudomonadota bacterium]|jgi:flagellar basal-body rod modification protein FlgD